MINISCIIKGVMESQTILAFVLFNIYSNVNGTERLFEREYGFDGLRRKVEGNLCPVSFHRTVHLNISQSILTFTYNKL